MALSRRMTSMRMSLYRRLRPYTFVLLVFLLASVWLNIKHVLLSRTICGCPGKEEKIVEFHLNPAKFDQLKTEARNAKRLREPLKPDETFTFHTIEDDHGKALKSWQTWQNSINQSAIYQEDHLISSDFLDSLGHQPIVGFETMEDYGTQLKFKLALADGNHIVCKPARHGRAEERHPNILYTDDLDRHTAEIAAFHLDRILRFHRVPPNVGRFINITAHIEPYAPQNWLEKIYTAPSGNKCFVGQCAVYCHKLYPVCGTPTQTDLFEASCAPWLPFENMEGRLNPWRRTYNPNVKAEWETNPNFCDGVKKEYNFGRRFLDLMDISIFDFLMGADDRDSFGIIPTTDESEYSTPLLYDNGAGFPYMHNDDRTILTPIIQCCRVRYSTLQRLLDLESTKTGNRLSDQMRKSLLSDPLTYGINGPILVEGHLRALDRRLSMILDAIWDCISVNGADDVIIDDGH